MALSQRWIQNARIKKIQQSSLISKKQTFFSCFFFFLKQSSVCSYADGSATLTCRRAAPYTVQKALTRSVMHTQNMHAQIEHKSRLFVQQQEQCVQDEEAAALSTLNWASLLQCHCCPTYVQKMYNVYFLTMLFFLPLLDMFTLP